MNTNPQARNEFMGRPIHRVNAVAQQGDITFERIESLPSTAVRKSDNVVAHSESGHHHVVVNGVLYTDSSDPLVSYVVGDEKGSVRFDHLKPGDEAHASIEFPRGSIVIKVYRQFDPITQEAVED